MGLGQLQNVAGSSWLVRAVGRGFSLVRCRCTGWELPVSRYRQGQDPRRPRLRLVGWAYAHPVCHYKETTPTDVFLQVTSDSIQGPPANVSAPVICGKMALIKLCARAWVALGAGVWCVHTEPGYSAGSELGLGALSWGWEL